MKNKVILVDSSGLFFPAVFNWERQIIQKNKTNSEQFVLPPHYVYFNSLLSCLKKIGVDENTLVIIALEGKSWRKKHYAPYKDHREKEREKHTLIDWDKEFRNLNKVNDNLNESTDWHLIREWSSECDDIIAVACRFYKDKEVIVASGDGDLKQLCYYENVKFFSFNKKCKGSKGTYEKISDPLKIIADKARKGDVSDNLIPSSNDTDEDYNLRYKLVNLLELPKEIEESIVKILSTLPEKKLNLDNFNLFKNSKQKFLKIYNKDKVITPDYCYKLIEKRKIRKEKRKKEKKDGV